MLQNGINRSGPSLSKRLIFAIALLVSVQLSASQTTNTHQFNLEQTTKVYKTEIDLYFDLFDRFLEGLRATVFSSNSMRCS